MRIKSIFSTQAGNIIVELYEEDDVKNVLEGWKPTFFATDESGDKDSGTNIIHMKGSYKPRGGVIKYVRKDWSEDGIKSELSKSFNSEGPNVQITNVVGTECRN